jgi:hypothetical protein
MPAVALIDTDAYRNRRLYTPATEDTVAPWLEGLRVLWKVFPMADLQVCTVQPLALAKKYYRARHTIVLR